MQIIPKLKIVVHETPTCKNVIAEFKSFEDLLNWNQSNKSDVTNISVNDRMLRGWRDIYDYIDMNDIKTL